MYDFKYNMDVERRDELVFKGKADPYDIKYFNALDVQTLAELLDANFADPEMTQNESPSIAEFYAFMVHCAEKYPENTVTAHGYVIGTEREDYRVSIEGLECRDPEDKISKDLLVEFLTLCKNADELEYKKTLRSWWD